MKRLRITAVLGLLYILPVRPALLAQEPGDVPERDPSQEQIARVRVAGSGAYLGVSLRDVTAEDVSRLGLPAEQGALIETVRDGSPAAEAGLLDGDVVTRWNGGPVESVAMLSRLVRETPPGRTVKLGVFRDGSARTLDVKLGERARERALAYALEPEMRARMEEMRERLKASGEELRLSREKLHLSEEQMREVRDRVRSAHERLLACTVEVEALDDGENGERRVVVIRGGRGRLGVGLQNLTDQLGDYFGVEGGAGALVTSVIEGSAADVAKVRAGDVIVLVGSTAVDGPGAVARAIREIESGPVELTVVRRGERRTVTVQLEERSDTTGDCEPLLTPEGPHSLLWPPARGHAFVAPGGVLAPRAPAPLLRPVPPRPPGEIGYPPAPPPPPPAPPPPASTT